MTEAVEVHRAMGNDRQPVPGCLSSPLLPQEATSMPGEVWAVVTLV